VHQLLLLFPKLAVQPKIIYTPNHNQIQDFYDISK